MSESDDPRPAADPTADPTAANGRTAPSEKERWRDRVFKMRMLIAVGAAGILIGGGAGMTAAVADDPAGPERGFQPHEGERGPAPGAREDEQGGGGPPESGEEGAAR